MKSFWKEKPVEDKKYKQFIREQPCLTPGCPWPPSPHHEQEPHKGIMGGKCDDRRCVPLCFSCHRKRHDYGRTFYKTHNIDVEAEIIRLNKEYEEKR